MKQTNIHALFGLSILFAACAQQNERLITQRSAISPDYARVVAIQEATGFERIQ